MNIVPQPVVVRQVCSLCGEDWALHGNTPSTLDCIRLLKAKVPAPVVYPVYPRPWYQPHWYWDTQVISTGSVSGTNGSGYTINAQSNTTTALNTPDEGEPPAPVAA